MSQLHPSMISAIQGEMGRFRLRVDLPAVALWLVSIVPYALGWLCGFMVRCVLWMAAALIAGFKSGRSS